jgi:hypothetical protein
MSADVPAQRVPAQRVPVQRRPLQKAGFLLIVAAAVFGLPYRVPVAPSISLSYIAGYNNRAAVLLLIAGTALFAWYTRGELARTEQQDARLGRWSLIVWLAIAVLLCAVRAHLSLHKPPGNESIYNLNRQQMLAAGLAPYRQFEYAYGLLLLYPGLWIARLLHVSAQAGYYAAWGLQWAAGTVLLWWLVRRIDLPLRYRVFGFSALMAIQLDSIPDEGPNYTPLRSYAAAVLVFAVYRVARGQSRVWVTAAAGVAAVALGMACSPEQGFGVAAGVGAYLLLMALRPQWQVAAGAIPADGKATARARWLALCGFGLGAAGLLAWCNAAGMFATLRNFSSGGSSFPVLPAPLTCAVLFLYVVAGCTLYRELRLRRLQSAAVPLVLAGCAMLPSAMGHADVGHLYSASPAALVGLLVLTAMPALRPWWFGLVFVLFFAVPLTLSVRGTPLGHELKALVAHQKGAPAAAAAVAEGSSKAFDHNKMEPVDAGELPCDRTYFSPIVAPLGTSAAFRTGCLDTGYYMQMLNVSTEEGIARKIAEMQQRPGEPLLLDNVPLIKEFATYPWDTNLENLRGYEGAWVVPRPRHAPVTLVPIIDYIQAHYRPGPEVAGGRLRIWYPISGSF